MLSARHVSLTAVLLGVELLSAGCGSGATSAAGAAKAILPSYSVSPDLRIFSTPEAPYVFASIPPGDTLPLTSESRFSQPASQGSVGRTATVPSRPGVSLPARNPLATDAPPSTGAVPTAATTVGQQLPESSSAPSPTHAPVVTHEVGGTITTQAEFDVVHGYPGCASGTYGVGQVVRITGGTSSTTGEIVSCKWQTTRQGVNLGLTPDFKYAVPIFVIVVSAVPEASTYIVSVGTKFWPVSGTTLAAANWQLKLS